MKKIKQFLANCNKKVKKFGNFLLNNVDDLCILLGMLAIVIATLICFGIGISLFVLGFFLIIVGIVNFSKLRNKILA